MALPIVMICGASSAQNLRLAVSRGPVSLPIYVADAQGFFDREGVQVQLSHCASGRACFAELAAGRADVATAAELVLTIDALNVKPAPVKLIATISASSQHLKLVGRRSAGVRSPSDLVGKRVATVAGSSADYFLDSWLIYHQIEPTTVVSLPMVPGSMVAALGAKQIDAMAIWEPIASAAVDELGQDAIVLAIPQVYTQHFNLISTQSAIDHRREDLVKVLRAVHAAEKFIEAQPALALKAMGEEAVKQRYGINLAEHSFQLSLQQSLIVTMEAQGRWAMRQGLVRPRGISGLLLEAVDPSLLRTAVPSAINLVK